MSPIPPDPRKKLDEQVAALREKSERLRAEARNIQEQLRRFPKRIGGAEAKPC